MIGGWAFPIAAGIGLVVYLLVSQGDPPKPPMLLVLGLP